MSSPVWSPSRSPHGTGPPIAGLSTPPAIAAAQARAQLPGAPSMYMRPGFQSFWHIAAGQDVRRDLTDQLLQGIAAVRNRPGLYFQLIVSSGGNGKSVLLLRLQYELAQAGEYVLVPAQEGKGLDLLELSAACHTFAKVAPGQRVYLLLDDVYRFNTPLLAVLMKDPIDNLTILATTRHGDFNSDSVLPAPPYRCLRRRRTPRPLLTPPISATSMIARLGIW